MTTEPTAQAMTTDLAALAEHHEKQGIFYARQATNDAPWYHTHERDTHRAAEHFAVAAALRAMPRPTPEPDERDAEIARLRATLEEIWDVADVGSDPHRLAFAALRAALGRPQP